MRAAARSSIRAWCWSIDQVAAKTVSSAGTGLRLAVRDDGLGLPAGVDLARSSSLGLQIVNTLVKQLQARLEVEVASGTCFRITVPVEA